MIRCDAFTGKLSCAGVAKDGLLLRANVAEMEEVYTVVAMLAFHTSLLQSLRSVSIPSDFINTHTASASESAGFHVYVKGGAQGDDAGQTYEGHSDPLPQKCCEAGFIYYIAQHLSYHDMEGVKLLWVLHAGHLPHRRISNH